MEQKKQTERTNSEAVRIALVTRRFYELNEKARKNNLLSLKDNIDANRKNYRDIFEYGLLLCVNGVDAARLNQILSNIVKHEKNEQERRFKSIQKEAVLHIKKGHHPGLFLCSLFSYLDIEEIKQVQSYLSGSIIYDDLQSLLEKSFYNDKIISGDYDNSHDTLAKPFGFFNNVDINILLEHLKLEQPRIIACVLALIESKKASHILAGLPEDLQSDIARRIAVMDNPDIQLLHDILNFEKRLLSISGRKYANMDKSEFKKLLKAYLLRENAVNEAAALYEKASNVTECSQEAADINNRLMQVMRGRPLDFIITDPVVFCRMLEGEHPKTIACILSVITPAKAAVMLQFLPKHLQCDVARRIVLMDKSNEATFETCGTSGELSHLEIRRMEKTLSAMFNKDCVFEGGIKKIVELLCLSDSRTEKTIMEFFEETSPKLFRMISDNMFVFEDIVMLADPAVQRVLRNADRKDLALAMKNMSLEIQDKIFVNMSKRAAIMLKEEIDFLKPVSVEECAEAQKKIVSVIRHLEEIGEIVIANYSDEEIV